MSDENQERMYAEIAVAFRTLQVRAGIEEEILKIEKERGMKPTVDPVLTYERGLEMMFGKYGGSTVEKALGHYRIQMRRRVPDGS